MYSTTEPFKGHGGGKNSGWVEKIRGGRKKYLSNVLRSLAKLLRSLEKLCVLLQRYLRSLANCVLSQNQLSSDKLFLFTLQLAVVMARMFTMERFIEFYFELGLNKVIQSVLSSRLVHRSVEQVGYIMKWNTQTLAMKKSMLCHSV